MSDLLAGGPFADAPIIPVSAHTGEGMDELRAALLGLAKQLPARGHKDLPVLLPEGLVSVVAFGLWIAFGDPSGTLGGKSLSPSGSGQVLDPDDPRSRKADKLPSAF